MKKLFALTHRLLLVMLLCVILLASALTYAQETPTGEPTAEATVASEATAEATSVSEESEATAEATETAEADSEATSASDAFPTTLVLLLGAVAVVAVGGLWIMRNTAKQGSK